MRKIMQVVLTLGVALGLFVTTVAPAGATLPTYENATWKNIDTNPNGLCGYSQGIAQGQQPQPGADEYVAWGINYYRDADPCTPGTTNVTQDAGNLEVQVSMQCSFTDLGTTDNRTGNSNIWTGNLKSNAQNTGAIAGGLLWSDYNINTCFSTVKTPWIRTVVKAYYWTAFGYVEVDHTTHWVDPCKFH